MRIRNWWYLRDGRSKAITVLAVLLLLQIGLCFQSPKVAPWFIRTFHVTSLDVPMQGLSLMIWQAALCAITACLLIAVVIGLFLSPRRAKNQHEDSHDR